MAIDRKPLTKKVVNIKKPMSLLGKAIARRRLEKKKELATALLKVKKLDGVIVKATALQGTINVTYPRTHVADIKLRWSRDHYAGFILDAKGKPGHAILAIWNIEEAKTFIKWYEMFIALSAMRTDPAMLPD